MGLRKWLRVRREREWQRIYNGHDLYVSREQANELVELTCRRCGFSTTNVEWVGAYVPYPIEQPCQADKTPVSDHGPVLTVEIEADNSRLQAALDSAQKRAFEVMGQAHGAPIPVRLTADSRRIAESIGRVNEILRDEETTP